MDRKEMAHWVLAIVALVAALLLAGCESAEDATGEAVFVPPPIPAAEHEQPLAVPPAVDAQPSQSEPETMSWDMWWATGACAPSPVTDAMLRQAVGPLTGETVWPGPYTVTIDEASRTVTVAGPEGADILQRDIMRCISAEAFQEYDGHAGTWRDGRYVDRPVERPLPAGESQS